MPSDLTQLAPAFRAALLGWYRRHARRLPWRERPGLYSTVVSEFMLQQTQVKTVLPYFARWLEEWPDFAALAGASEERVLRLWEGLGYYSRARNLHWLARAVAALPEPPRTPAAWRELPGVGPYTAAAITSIAFGHPAACVDGNVVRILARLTADGTAYRDSVAAARALGPLAEVLLDHAAPGDHNQAMMELGATVCLPRTPACLTCPVREFCAGAREGKPEELPRLQPRLLEDRTVVRVWCRRGGALLLHRTPEGSRRLARVHELPSAEQAGLTEAAVRGGPLLARKRRGITRYRITEFIHELPPTALPAGGAEGLVWVMPNELDALTLSGPHRRWVRELFAR